MSTTPHRPGLIDSSILVDANRKRPDGVAFVANALAAGWAATCDVCMMELVVGCRDAAELRQVEAEFAAFVAYPVTSTASKSAYDLLRRYRLSHNLLIHDAQIAATTLELGLPIYTLNLKHFNMIPGLTAIRPY